MFGVDGAGAFAEAHAVAEDLGAADAGCVDEAAQAVEAEEASLEVGFGFVWRNRAGSAIDERTEYLTACSATTTATVGTCRRRTARHRRAARRSRIAAGRVRRPPSPA